MTTTDTFVTGYMLVDGQLVESRSGEWLTSINPADESEIGRVPLANDHDVAGAVDAAYRAQPIWAALDIRERSRLINQLADAIADKAEDIARLESRDTGNTIGPMTKDVSTAVERMRLAAGLGYEIKGETIPATADGIHMTVRQPYGIVGRIIPFNHPIGFAASRLAPALMAGNSIVIKPSEQSPLSACVLGELCRDLLPPGVVNIVTGTGSAGDALVRHPLVKRIAFIGSMSTGMAIQRAAAEVSVKHVTLELGGKNPMIICPDADLDRAATAAVAGMNFAWQGQSCGSTSRLILHESVHDSMLERVVDKVSKIKVGNPLDPASDMGPMNSKQHYERVLHYLNAGKVDGARLVYGGNRVQGPEFKRGYWIEPTVFDSVTMDMRIANEEIFGPVLSVLSWNDDDDAIAMANQVEYGLTASIWTSDLNRAMRFSKAVEAGYIWVNGTGTHFRGVPYGGLKNSGIGREEGLDELLSYTEVKAINILLK